ncbi:MAG TPA: RRXRR domain-containing protein [Ktedonobacteraceae bacterium]|nr:RRXRR domain-containing protein [Ktedonobacteraceae bacterium]
MFVYVLSCHSKPLMPCQPRKARLLLKGGKAKVVKMVRRNNRQLHKATIRKGGKRQRNTAPKYVHGFRLFDCVKHQGQTCFVFGRRSSGYFDLRTLDGAKVHASASYKKLAVVQKASALLVERRAAFPPVS